MSYTTGALANTAADGKVTFTYDVTDTATATGAASGGWLTAYPSDAAPPTASSLNFSAGQTVAGLVKLRTGADGKIKITNTGGIPSGGGTVQIIADIVGYYQ